MASEPWLNPIGCFLLSSWLSAFVPILAVPMKHIFLFPKRLRDYALGQRWLPLRSFLLPAFPLAVFAVPTVPHDANAVARLKQCPLFPLVKKETWVGQSDRL